MLIPPLEAAGVSRSAIQKVRKTGIDGGWY